MSGMAGLSFFSVELFMAHEIYFLYRFQNTGGRQMKRIILFVSIISVLAYHSVVHSAILLDRVVAVVNQEVITWSDLYKAMEFEASDKMQELTPDEKRRIFKENI